MTRIGRRLLRPAARRFLARGLLAALLAAQAASRAQAGDENAPVPPTADDVAQQRLVLMRDRVRLIRFLAAEDEFPERLEAEPLFRYDDVPRGYVDGTVWRLGASGRPRAIVTAELHPRYGGNPRIVYDLLSLSDVPFRATSADVAGWTPPGSAVTMKPLAGAAAPGESEVQRLVQMKRLAARFRATQEVEGERLQLRLLPRAIDRYVPADAEHADGAIFVFASGRMPGIVLLIETDGRNWRYGIGRLSGPSTLTVALDGADVWEVPPATYRWNEPYTATNASAVIPGTDPSIP